MPFTALPGVDAAAHDLRHSVHFLQAITQLAEQDNVITHSAIFSAKGLKLVDAGARIDARTVDRLRQTPLRAPIDQHLLVDNMVCIPSIEAEALVQCQGGGLIAPLARTLGGAGRLLAPLRFMPLPLPVAFQMTLMREQRPLLYGHSLQMMLVALYLGMASGWSERECVPLAAAGLLHDIGMLYLPPSWADAHYQLNPEERKQLVAHSVTAVAVLQQQQAYPPQVLQAVLEHHERMDGSGYPRGVAAAQISPMGQVLMLAEVVSAMHQKYADMPGPRTSLMLRMNHRRYPAGLVQKILPLLASALDTQLEIDALNAEVTRLASVLGDGFAQWQQLRAGAAQAPAQSPARQAIAWVDGRLQLLQQELAQAGSHPQQLGGLLGYLQDDRAGMAELALLHREALWQLESIAQNGLRRWPQLLARATPVDAALADWCQARGQPGPAAALGR